MDTRQQVPSCPGGTLYTIRAGDTFFSLAARFNTSVDAIIEANPNVNPDALAIGQQICIPRSSHTRSMPRRNHLYH